jgi:hypothetical protein
MPAKHVTSSFKNRVSVTYGDGLHAFWLRSDATLAEVAAHVGTLDAFHAGAALTVDIAFQQHRPRQLDGTPPPLPCAS